MVFNTIGLTAKRLGLLHELVAKVAVVAVMLDPTLPGSETELRDAEEAGHTIGLQILIVRAADEHEINAAFAKVVQAGAGALLVGSGPVFLSQRRQLVALAARHALPASYVTRQYPEAGGLMSYGPSTSPGF